MAEKEPEIASRFARKTTLGGKSSEGVQGNNVKPQYIEKVIPEKGEKVDQDGNVQKTIYLDPEQWRNLRQLRRQIEDQMDEMPNVQDMIRYLVAMATIENFSGFADFMRQEGVKRKQRRRKE